MFIAFWALIFAVRSACLLAFRTAIRSFVSEDKAVGWDRDIAAVGYPFLVAVVDAYYNGFAHVGAGEEEHVVVAEALYVITIEEGHGLATETDESVHFIAHTHLVVSEPAEAHHAAVVGVVGTTLAVFITLINAGYTGDGEVEHFE